MAKETGKETANSARDREMALFKFSLIAPVVAGTFTQTTKMDYYKETCSRKHLLPGGKAVKLSPLTLKKWYWLYTSGGLEALLPKTRSDLGESRVLSVDACRQIEAYRKQFPHITGRKIYEKTGGGRVCEKRSSLPGQPLPVSESGRADKGKHASKGMPGFRV